MREKTHSRFIGRLLPADEGTRMNVEECLEGGWRVRRW